MSRIFGAAESLIATFVLVAAMAAAHASTPADLQAAYAANADAAPMAARGQALFTADHGREWRCASCHGALPVAAGRHAVTGKEIAPLAPAYNAERFTDAVKTERWFRRNCRDVLGRECSADEKADVIAWLRTLR